MIGGCHTAWPIATDALQNEAVRLNIFTVCLESLTTMMVLIMELFTHLPPHMWLIRDAGETRSSKVCQTTQLLSYQWLLSAAVCLGGKITPCSLTAGSLSALNYTKLVPTHLSTWARARMLRHLPHTFKTMFSKSAGDDVPGTCCHLPQTWCTEHKDKMSFK